MTSTLRLIIAKYSYSPDFPISTQLPVASENKIAWTTIGDPNMSIVFEPSKFGLLHSSHPELCLKVMREVQVLELVQLQRLCEAATNAMWNQKPIQAVVSSPRLAITYHVGEGNARRLQFRFPCEADFESALRVLEDLRCPITAATNRPRTAQRLNYPQNTSINLGDRPTTSSSTDVMSPQQYSTPATKRDVSLQPYSAANRYFRDPSSLEGLERQVVSRNQIRPSTAPLVNMNNNCQSESRSWHTKYTADLRSPQSQDEASMEISFPTKANLPPLPAQALRNITNSRNSMGFQETNSGPSSSSNSQIDADSTHVLISSATPNVHHNCTSNVVTSLREYSSKPDQERQEIIDSILCSYLNCNDFLQLCEDVENTWRRIGIEIRK